MGGTIDINGNTNLGANGRTLDAVGSQGTRAIAINKVTTGALLGGVTRADIKLAARVGRGIAPAGLVARTHKDLVTLVSGSWRTVDCHLEGHIGHHTGGLDGHPDRSHGYK